MGGFYPGMEVVFGDTLATTTTFWGDKCLNCLTPPALQLTVIHIAEEQLLFGHEGLRLLDLAKCRVLMFE
jgi:hypothetical protein